MAEREPAVESVSREARKLLRFAAQVQSWLDAVRVFRARYPPEHAPVQAACGSDEPTYHWNTVVRSAWRSHYILGKAQRSAERILADISELKRDPRADALLSDRPPPAMDMTDWPGFSRTLRAHWRISPRIVDFIGVELERSGGDLTAIAGDGNLRSWIARLGRVREAFGGFIQDTLMPASKPETRHKATTRPPPDSDGGIDCDKTSDPETCKDAATVGLIISIAVVLADLISRLDDPEDDKARLTIERSTCADIEAMSNKKIIGLFKKMMDGPTLDGDEQAMMRALNCLPCKRVKQIVNSVGKENLLFDFDGSEWDELMIRLHECGIVRFSEWDDDATRDFIRRSDCGTINTLTNAEIRQLMLNLFEGGTGDEDEKAILRVFRCLPACRIMAIRAMPDMSVEDFDDEVDGDEWDQLSGIFWSAFVNCPTG